MGKEKKQNHKQVKKPAKSDSAWKKIWYFIWHDDSIWSWVINIVLAFILIKFVIFPGLGFILGTEYPVVAVVSGSMEHDGSFEDWWESDYCGRATISVEGTTQRERYEAYNITKPEFLNFPFENGFNTGDIMILQSANKVRVGDVIVFAVQGQVEPIIHRVVSVKESEGKYYYNTKGDHNCGVGVFEKDIPEGAVLGKSLFRIPFLGWIKIIFVKIIEFVRF